MMRIPYKKVIGQEVKPGRPSIGKKPGKPELKKLYIKEAKSIREISKILRCSKDMIYRSLVEYGIERRPDNKRSKLRYYNRSFLKRLIKEKGITKAANELVVNRSTLKKYIE